MTVNFGDVMMIDFGDDNINSVQVGVRPGVIIQNDIGNKYSPTSIAVPLTSEIKKLNMPCHKVLHMNEQNCFFPWRFNGGIIGACGDKSCKMA